MTNYEIKHNDNKYSITIPENYSGEEYYTVCPICTPHRKPEHQKDKKLAINFKIKDMPWRCNHCGEAGYLISDHDMQRKAIKPLINYNRGETPSEGLYEYFANKRNISKNTIDHFKIRMTRRKIMSKATKTFVETKCISYPYFYNGQVINVKYKTEFKDFSSISKADAIFYNIDSLKNSEIAYIVEGEDDVSALYEVGITPVISVPNGVTISDEERKIFEDTGVIEIKNTVNLEYLDKCINDLDHIKTFILATDSDAPGFKLREELSRRLGKDVCKYILFNTFNKPDGTPCKDANDVLIHHSKEGLNKCISEKNDFPMEDVVTLDMVWDKMKVSFNHGKVKGKSTGFKTLDPHFTLRLGHLIDINGFPASGKSIFAMTIALVTAVLHDWKWGLYMPESYPVEDAYDTIVEMLVGNTSDISWDNRMSYEDYKVAAHNFVKKYIYFVDREKGYTPEELRDVARRMIKKYGITGFITDPWNSLTEKRNKGEDLVPYLTRELSAEHRLVTHNNIVKIICTHPPTPDTPKGEKYKAPSPFNVDGGAIWFKKVYDMVALNKEDENDLNNTNVEVYVWKTKNHKLVGIPTGRSPKILQFNRRSNRYYEDVDGLGTMVCPLDGIFKEIKRKLFGKIEGF
jgi:twinkle protein